MDEYTEPFETLKQILRHVRDPHALDDHPWVNSLIVQEAVVDTPELQDTSPGQQLVRALACLFPQLQPSAPPRRGKRLDPRWGEFGLLAALYFTPFNHGTPFPTSFLDAWARIDQAILYFVFKKPVEALRKEEIDQYQLVGSDVEYGSASTLSDWHKKGLQRFAEVILDRERFLSRTQGKPSIILEPGQPDTLAPSRMRTSHFRRLWPVLALTLILVLGLVAFKAWKIYQSGMLLYHDVTDLQETLREPVEIKTVDTVVPLLRTVQGDLSSFKAEARLLLWLSPKLSWVPIYGNDLASAPVLIELAEHVINAADLSIAAARPLLAELDSKASALTPVDVAALLVQAQPQLVDARQELDDALSAREKIDAERLSPRLQNVLVNDLDPILKLADDGLALGMALPGMLGAGSDGPKTYLLLVQNEDELRPTGGFITSVGNLVVSNGQIISLDFEEAGELEDWSKPYPAAPWQLQQYMNSPVLVLRDSNWFTDFPTAALWAEYLYAYTHSHSVDGVIAFDQQFLVMLLGHLGPLEVEGASYPITENNVVEFMRQAKAPPSDGPIPVNWYRKAFIGNIANAILKELINGQSHDWRGLAQVMVQALKERHLLLQLDDPTLAALIAEQGWDNAVQPGDGDFLMVTDTNIGFNKTNAVVEASLSYDVDLTDLSVPKSTLVVTDKNNASQDVPCIQWDSSGQISGEEGYPIDRCYWNYLRVYKQQDTKLLEASPHAIPGSWMLLGKAVPARVDELEEEIPGVRGFGTLLVVPGGGSMNTSFTFALPRTILVGDKSSNQIIYRLKIQKQPGTIAIPLTLRIHLPNRATLRSISSDAVVQENHLLINTNLRMDLEFEVVFSLP